MPYGGAGVLASQHNDSPHAPTDESFRVAARQEPRPTFTSRLKIMNRNWLNLAILVAFLGVIPTRGADAVPAPKVTDTTTTVPRLWKPVADTPFLQEVGEQIRTEKAVTDVAYQDGRLYAVVQGALRVCDGGGLKEVPGVPTGITRLRSLQGALWVGTPQGAHRLGKDGWKQVSEVPLVDFTTHLGKVHGASVEDIYRFEDGRFVNVRPADGWLSNDSTMVQEDFSQILADPVGIGPIQRLMSYCDTLYVQHAGRLALIEGRTFVPDPIDWGSLPSRELRDALVQGSRLWVATSRGLGVLRGMAMSAIRGRDGLPYEDTTCLAAGFDDDLWVGTTRGAIRRTGSEYHYFGAAHWLPGDRVNAIAVDGHEVAIATDAGLGIIRYEPFTLAKKAAYFEREMDSWGFKRLGFIHQLYRDSKGEWLREISDNDGGNTAGWLAAMSFKYAATHDESARREAVGAFKAMVWLDDITPQPGFIARAVWSVKGDRGERSTRGSGGLPAKWYPTPDGQWLWKGDTSSDEVNAHYYAMSLFHDLAAVGPEKERAAAHVAAITSHILDNGWKLRDMDGKTTRWGRWDPEYLLRPYGFEARGLNGMEAQTYVTTAFALTGDLKYRKGLEQTIQWRYHTYTVRQKITFPPDSVVPWDDELSFRCYVPLLRYSTDPELRSIYLRSLARSWEVQRMQQIPFFNFIYGFLTGHDCEVPEAAQHLREWSLDLVSHSYHNSHRTDLEVRRSDYTPYGSGSRTISPREADAKWGSRLALELDGGNGGRVVTPPIGWLEDYWMGRYFGFIQPPAGVEPGAVRLESPAPVRRGAAKYD